MAKIYLESLNGNIKPFLDSLEDDQIKVVTDMSRDPVLNELKNKGIKAVKGQMTITRKVNKRDIIALVDGKVVQQQKGDQYAIDNETKMLYHVEILKKSYNGLYPDILRIYPGNLDLRFASDAGEIVPTCKIEDFYLPLFNLGFQNLYLLVQVPDDFGGHKIDIKAEFYYLDRNIRDSLRIRFERFDRILTYPPKDCKRTSLRFL
jgi:hypothetical protein